MSEIIRTDQESICLPCLLDLDHDNQIWKSLASLNISNICALIFNPNGVDISRQIGIDRRLLMYFDAAVTVQRGMYLRTQQDVFFSESSSVAENAHVRDGKNRRKSTRIGKKLNSPPPAPAD